MKLLQDRRVILIFLAIVTMALVLSFLLVNSDVGEVNYFLALMLVAIGIAPLIRSFMKKTDYFEAINIFCLLFVLSIGIRGLAILDRGSQWLVSYDSSSGDYRDLMFRVFSYGILALAALYLGYWSGLGSRVGARIPRVRFFPTNRSNLLVVVTVALLAGILAVYLLLDKIGGSAVMADSSAMIEEGIESGGRLYLSLFLEFAVIGFLFLFVGIIGKKKGVVEIILLALFTLLIMSIFLILPFKGQVIGILGYMLITVNYLRKRISLKTLVPLIIVAIMLLPALDNYRKYGIDSLDQVWSEYWAEFDNLNSISELTLSRSAGTDMFFLAIDRTPDPNPYLYGSSMAKVFTSFIPRSLYPDKAWSFGIDFSNQYLDAPLLASISPSTIGELYINFHVVGIIAGFFIIGVFLRTVYTYCINNGVTREGVIIYAIIMEKMIMLVDGPVSDFFVFVLINLFPVAVLGLLAMILSTRNAERRIVKFS